MLHFQPLIQVVSCSNYEYRIPYLSLSCEESTSPLREGCINNKTIVTILTLLLSALLFSHPERTMAHILSSVAGSIIDLQPVRRALLSVSDKTGLLEVVALLASYNVELLSTGGTAKAIADAGFDVIDVSDYTGSPEILV